MCLAAIKSAGFEVIEYTDLADSKSNPLVKTACEPWHSPLKGPVMTPSALVSLENLSRFKMHPWGRAVTDCLVWLLERLGIAPAGTGKVSKVLNLGADALVKAGDLELFTPMFFFLVQKPDAK